MPNLKTYFFNLVSPKSARPNRLAPKPLPKYTFIKAPTPLII